MNGTSIFLSSSASGLSTVSSICGAPVLGRAINGSGSRWRGASDDSLEAPRRTAEHRYRARVTDGLQRKRGCLEQAPHQFGTALARVPTRACGDGTAESRERAGPFWAVTTSPGRDLSYRLQRDRPHGPQRPALSCGAMASNPMAAPRAPTHSDPRWSGAGRVLTRETRRKPRTGVDDG